jgi:hypothetical protein
MQGEVEITAPYPLLSKAGIKKDFSLTLISDSSIKILGGAPGRTWNNHGGDL